MQRVASRVLWLFAVLLVVLVPQPSGRALDVEVSGRLVSRTLLAIYDSKTEGPAHQTRLHKLAEMPLNHLGFVVEYRDVNAALPTGDDLAKYRAIVTWFVEPLADPAGYVRWLEAAVAAGPRYVMLGEVAPRETDELIAPINRVLNKLGLAHGGNFIDLTYRSKIAAIDTAMVGFEQKLDKALPGFPLILQKASDVEAHLTIDALTADGSKQSVVVATSPRGGFAAQNFTVVLEPNTDRLGWVLDPFTFFIKALGNERFPVPDVTTVSGRRIYFSQIDGDGWNNLSDVEGHRQVLSSEVVARELIEPFPDLPVSVGLIAGDVQPLLGGNPEGAAIARRLFELRQVEVASHTHTHPFNWGFFEKYDRAEEEKRIKNYRPPDQPLRERITAALARAAGRAVVNQRYDPYVSGSDDLPRTYLKQPFTLENEIVGALRVSEGLAPPGKKAKLYLWSGDTTPFEGAVAATRKAGVRNINGGDSRLDPEYPSVAYVPPLSRPVGRERQIYAVNSNENTYTNDWTGPFNGQALLVNTLARTDAPRRLKGFDLYYHMYSGEKQSSLRAVRRLLEMARGAAILPMDASQYAAMADDYFGAEIIQTGPLKWVVRNRGAVETVRFDFADDLVIDGTDSKGVLGGNRHQGSLYVSLDPAVAEAHVSVRARAAGEPEVRLVVQANSSATAAPTTATTTDTSAATITGKGTGAEPLVHVIESRWRLSARLSSECSQTMQTEGYGPAEMLFESQPNRAFRIKLARDRETLIEEIRWTNALGRLSLNYTVDGRSPLSLTFTCHD